MPHVVPPAPEVAPSATPRVRVGAIAKNEGAHLVDWVFHHLYFGFDGVVIWVNGTSDPSLEILERIAAVDPRVTFKVADQLLAESLAEGRSSQQRAYRRMAKRSAKAGFTHLACLDLDEYWTPRDLTSRVGDFLAPEAAVTSFPWALDVPDRAAEPFRSPFDALPALQLDRHVKSVLSLDERLQLVLTHTGRILPDVDGPAERRWVREQFPLVDEQVQHFGSVAPREWLAERDAELPEAFVLHAMHRSPLEYVSSLDRGRQQTGRQTRVKDNRHGFTPSPAPQLAFPEHPDALAAYLRVRDEFRAAVGAEELVNEARAQVRQRRDDLVGRAAADPDLLQVLRKPLRHLPVPELDAAHPGWDTPLHWRAERLVLDAEGRPTHVEGWAFDERGVEVIFGLEDSTGTRFERLQVERRDRADVPLVLPQAPGDSGYLLPLPGTVDLTGAKVLARPIGASAWEAWPLPAIEVSREGHESGRESADEFGHEPDAVTVPDEVDLSVSDDGRQASRSRWWRRSKA